jgi:hypothetical protein
MSETLKAINGRATIKEGIKAFRENGGPYLLEEHLKLGRECGIPESEIRDVWTKAVAAQAKDELLKAEAAFSRP